MAEKETAARPYAEAVFSLAKERGSLKEWSGRLAIFAALASHETIQRLASDPRIARARLLGLLLDIVGKDIDAETGNFLRLLVENRRLSLLPEIASLYETLKAEAEARIEATVVSAFPLDDVQRNTLEQGLGRRFGRTVHLTTEVDRQLVGGVIIRAGDLVIDGSVRGHLATLAAEMRH